MTSSKIKKLIKKWSKELAVKEPVILFPNKKSEIGNGSYNLKSKMITLHPDGKNIDVVKHEFIHYLQHQISGVESLIDVYGQWQDEALIMQKWPMKRIKKWYRGEVKIKCQPKRKSLLEKLLEKLMPIPPTKWR